MLESKQDILCYKCNQAFDLGQSVYAMKVGRQDECPHCYASLHCCKMCGFYDKSAYNECKEPMADRILDKEKANFCDFFKISSGGNGGNDKDNLLNAANALFKD